MILDFNDVNNQDGGCVGMCPENFLYTWKIQKQVPGTSNFVNCYEKAIGAIENFMHNQKADLLVQAICGGNAQAPIRFALMNRITNEVFNSFETTVEQLTQGGLTTLHGQAGASLRVRECSLFIKPSLVDYLRAGWQIGMVAAIDFTASNGEPSSPSSLHYQGTGVNPYESAIYNVGKIVEPYDLD